MRVRIHPLPSDCIGTLTRSVTAPPSKSYTHRAIAVALLARGTSVITNPLYSDDTWASIRAARRLGARIIASPRSLQIYSHGMPRWTPTINCGESGTTLRIFYAIAGLQGKPILFYGRGRLHERPLAPLARAMEQLGAETILYRGCCPPAAVKGPMRRGETVLNAGESSQYLTALLIALSALPGSSIEVTELSSKGYVDVTIRVLAQFGVEVVLKPSEYIPINNPKPSSIHIPGDWSSAAPLLTIGGLLGCITVGGLDPEDPHPDRAILSYLVEAGIDVVEEEAGISVTSPLGMGLHDIRPIKRACVDAHPDLAPTLAALAAHACGESRICCIQRLRLKESDRVESILSLLRQAGVKAWLEEDDCIVIEGACRQLNLPETLKPAPDHRIVMAAAVLSVFTEHPVVIENADAVSKSFPGFWDTLSQIMRVEKVPD